MEVQLYVEEEKKSLIANPDEWKAKVTELGLEAQLELVAEPDSKPCPFLRMDKGMTRVFEELCPEKTLVEAFGKEPIPMEALGVYGLAVKEQYFTKVEIWYNPKESDPVMVGYVGKKDSELFLMARWGLERLTLDELAARARVKWLAKAKSQLQKSQERIKEQLATIESLATDHFNGEWVYLR